VFLLLSATHDRVGPGMSARPELRRGLVGPPIREFTR
jgi:hypothetical protein